MLTNPRHRDFLTALAKRQLRKHRQDVDRVYRKPDQTEEEFQAFRAKLLDHALFCEGVIEALQATGLQEGTKVVE